MYSSYASKILLSYLSIPICELGLLGIVEY